MQIAFDLICGNLPARPSGQSNYPDGIRYAWFGGDFAGLRRDLRRGEISYRQAIGWLGRSLEMAIRADAHVCWRWDDPLPALGGVFREILFGVRKRVGRFTSQRN